MKLSGISFKGHPGNYKQNISYLDKYKYDRNSDFTRRGNRIDVGMGCIYVGTPDLVLESYGFETCSPFVMLPKNKNKQILAHIDSRVDPKELVEIIKINFSEKEIENAEYHYFRGEEAERSQEKLGQYAIDTIEEALSMLGVEGKFHGKISGDDKIVVDSNGIKLQAA